MNKRNISVSIQLKRTEFYKQSILRKILAQLFVFLFFYISTSYAQTQKEKDFNRAATTVFMAFAQHDSVTLAKYIDTSTGVFLLYRSGVFDNYSQYSTITFSDPGYPTSAFRHVKGLHLLPLQNGKLPTYDCDTDKWSKYGFFVNRTGQDSSLSQIVHNRIKYLNELIPQATVNKYRALEQQSRRLVYARKNGGEFIFYLSYLKGKWRITMVDIVTSDCSA